MLQQYDRDFKLKLCKQIDKGETTVSAVSKEYSISRPIVSRWVSEYRRYQNKAFSGTVIDYLIKRISMLYKNKLRNFKRRMNF